MEVLFLIDTLKAIVDHYHTGVCVYHIPVGKGIFHIQQHAIACGFNHTSMLCLLLVVLVEHHMQQALLECDAGH